MDRRRRRRRRRRRKRGGKCSSLSWSSFSISEYDGCDSCRVHPQRVLEMSSYEKRGLTLRHLLQLFTIIVSLVSLYPLTVSAGVTATTAGDGREEEEQGQGPAGDIPDRHKRPNIVFIMIDDAGWNDIGYQSTDIAFTQPNIIAAAKEGVILSSYYSEPHCTPARSAFMTGRYAINVGMTSNDIESESPFGLPLEYHTIADHLKGIGYHTHHIGKWNLGHYMEEYLPTGRGFDTFTGFLGATLGSYTSRKIVPQVWGAIKDLVHVWDWITGDRDGWRPGEEKEGSRQFSTDLLTDLAIDRIRASAATDNPFFIYLAYQATHSDVEAGIPGFDSLPGMEGIGAPLRRIVAAQWISLDNGFKLIVDALGAAGVLDHTIIVMASDNGGCPSLGNYVDPLRGVKTSLFEGAVRVPAFITSPLIPVEARGTVLEGLFHVSDWLPTLYRAVGGDVEKDLEPHGLDGMEQWTYLIEPVKESILPPRTEALLYAEQYKLSWDNDDKTYVMELAAGPFMAYRMGDYKLIMNSACMGYYKEMHGSVSCMNEESAHVCDQHGLEDICSSSNHYQLNGQGTRCHPIPVYGRNFLFNIKEDPTESHDLLNSSDEMRQMERIIATKMWSIVLQAPYPAYKYNDVEGMKLMFNTWIRAGGYVVPWMPRQETRDMKDITDVENQNNKKDVIITTVDEF